MRWIQSAQDRIKKLTVTHTMFFDVTYIAKYFFPRQGLSLVLFVVLLFQFWEGVGGGGGGRRRRAGGRASDPVG